jgi:hypothetical protein
MIEPTEGEIVDVLNNYLNSGNRDTFHQILIGRAIAEIKHLRMRVADLKNGFEGSCTACEPVAEMNRKLMEERDEARWEVCGFHHLTGFLAGDYAISRGWNYFNDERKWPKFPQSVTDFKLFLEGQDKIFLESNDRLRKERDEARRLLKAVVDMMRDNMAPDATHPKHVCDFIYCPEIATCMVCENWTDALVMCYPDDFQDEEETK